MSNCDKCDCELLPYVHSSYCPVCSERLEKAENKVRELDDEVERLRSGSSQIVTSDTVGLHHLMHTPEAYTAVGRGVRKDDFIRILLDKVTDQKKMLIEMNQMFVKPIIYPDLQRGER